MGKKTEKFKKILKHKKKNLKRFDAYVAKNSTHHPIHSNENEERKAGSKTKSVSTSVK
jgi:hypothetical protein